MKWDRFFGQRELVVRKGFSVSQCNRGGCFCVIEGGDEASVFQEQGCKNK